MEVKQVCFACVVCVLVLFIWCHTRSPRSCANDNRCYEVANRADKERAAALLADINRFIIEYLRWLRAKYIWRNGDTRVNRGIYTDIHTDISFKDRVLMIQRLFHNYSPDIVGENDPSNTTNTSYVLNKNDEMKFCLREKVTGNHNFIDLEDLKFVVLHELSHMADENYGHTRSYWRTFKVILQEAVASGVYVPRDYAQHPFNYCGLVVRSNPLYDTTL
jgi:hypothetical protein